MMDVNMGASSGPPTPPHTDAEDEGGVRPVATKSTVPTNIPLVPSDATNDLFASPPENRCADICERCGKEIRHGLVMRLSHSYHSSCFGMLEKENVGESMEVSSYVNLEMDNSKTSWGEDSFSKDPDLPIMGFPALTTRRPTTSAPPTPIATTTTSSGDEHKSSSPRGASFIFSRVSKFRRKPSSKSKDGEVMGRPPKPGGGRGGGATLLPVSASSFDLPDPPVNPVERRRAASLSVPQGAVNFGLPGHWTPTGHPTGHPTCHPSGHPPFAPHFLPNYQNLFPARSPPRGPESLFKVAFPHRGNHRDYALVDYEAKETAQNLAGMSLDASLRRRPSDVASRHLPLGAAGEFETETDYTEMDFTSLDSSRSQKKKTTTSSSSSVGIANRNPKNTQSLDRSLKRSKARMFARAGDGMDSGPPSIEGMTEPDSRPTRLGTSPDSRAGFAAAAAAVGVNWFASLGKDKSAQPIPVATSPKSGKGPCASAGTTPPLSLSDPSRSSFLANLASSVSPQSSPPGPPPIVPRPIAAATSVGGLGVNVPIGSWNKYRPRSGKQYANTEMLRISIGSDGVPPGPYSSSSGSRERTNSSETDQELSPPQSLDATMGSPTMGPSTVSSYVFAKPLPVKSTSWGRGPLGGSPHTQFEMDSLSPSGVLGGALLSTTVAPLRGPGEGDVSAAESPPLSSMEEPPYLDMSISSPSQMRTIVSDDVQLPQNTLAHHNSIVERESKKIGSRFVDGFLSLSKEEDSYPSLGSDPGPASLDAGPASLDAGPASLDAGPASLDAGPSSFNVRALRDDEEMLLPPPPSRESEKLSRRLLSADPRLEEGLPPEVSEPVLNYLEFEPGSKVKPPRPTEESVQQELEYYARLYGGRGPPMSVSGYLATTQRGSSHLPQVPEIPTSDETDAAVALSAAAISQSEAYSSTQFSSLYSFHVTSASTPYASASASFASVSASAPVSDSASSSNLFSQAYSTTTTTTTDMTTPPSSDSSSSKTFVCSPDSLPSGLTE